MNIDEEFIAQFNQQIDEIIARNGHACMQIVGDTPDETFTYSVGLAEFSWHEFIVMSLNPRTGATIINEVVTKLKSSDTRPADGMIVEEALSVPVKLRKIAPEKVPDYFKASRARLRRLHLSESMAEGMQIIWPDQNGRFPTEPGYDDEKFPQPLL